MLKFFDKEVERLWLVPKFARCLLALQTARPSQAGRCHPGIQTLSPIYVLPYHLMINNDIYITLELVKEHGLKEDEYARDRKSTRLNSSHANISYAVFCLKKKNNTHK